MPNDSIPDSAVLKASQDLSFLSVAIIGHVDVGKSTLLGHLMSKLGLVDQRLMHKYTRESAEMNKASFKYAWILDTYTSERERGITLDVALHMFATKSKVLAMLDCPGHHDLIPKVISAAAQSDVALLVLDACFHSFQSTFERGETKQHIVILRSMGVTSIIVVLNKIDKCEGKEEYDKIVQSITTFLQRSGFQSKDTFLVPVSALNGDNLIQPDQISKWAPWYSGPTLLDTLDALPTPKRMIESHEVRLPIADVFRSITGGTCVAGRLECGTLKVGDKVAFQPGNLSDYVVKHLRIRDETGSNVCYAGENVEVTLHGANDMVGLVPGLVMVPASKKVSSLCIGTRLEIQILLLSDIQKPILMGTSLMLHTHTLMMPATVLSTTALLNKKTNEVIKKNPKCLRADELGIVLLQTDLSVCCETIGTHRGSVLTRVILRQANSTVAVGVIRAVSA